MKHEGEMINNNLIPYSLPDAFLEKSPQRFDFQMIRFS